MPTTARELSDSFSIPGVRLGAPPVEAVRRLPSGIAPLDALLGGGLPRGHLSELVGGPSSGRTALLHAWVAASTRAGEVAAVIDLPDGLDPRSLARAGADLGRVLWVRPPSPRIALKCAELIIGAGGFGFVALELERTEPVGAARYGRPQFPITGGHIGPPLRGSGALRVPSSAWTRLAQVTRRGGAAVAILSRQRVAANCAALALELTPRRVRWDTRLFEGFTTNVALTRSRFGAAERAVTLCIGDQRPTDIDGVRMEWMGGGEERRASG